MFFNTNFWDLFIILSNHIYQTRLSHTDIHRITTLLLKFHALPLYHHNINRNITQFFCLLIYNNGKTRLHCQALPSLNYSIFVFPPMYGCNAFGIFTVPSAFKLFSKNAISILGGATTVLFNVCARYFLPSLPLTRILRRLA